MSRHTKFAADSSVLSLVIPNETRERILAIADALGQSKSDVSRAAILVGITALEKDIKNGKEG